MGKEAVAERKCRMQNSLTKIIDIIILVAVLFYATALFLGNSQDSLTESYLEGEVSEFTEAVSTKGFLTKQMYEDFLVELDGLGVLADIDISAESYMLAPEYDMYSVEEARKKLAELWTGVNLLKQEEVETTLPVVNIGVDSSGLIMNTQTNTSVIAAAVNTPAADGHVHTAACYAGHNHQLYGCLYHTHSGYEGSCYSGPYTNLYPYGYSSSGDDELLTGTSTYYNITCNKSEGWQCGYSTNDTNALCGSILTGIEATNQTQTVYQDEAFITTIQATFMDGSKKTFLSTADRTSSVTGTYTVTLSYTGRMDALGSIKTFTCPVTVTVVLRTKVCSHGHIYPATLAACPYCDAYVDTLQVTGSLVSGGKVTIYQGTTLKENEIGLLVTYMDGDTKSMTDGWLDNLDNDYVGVQTVTISYNGKDVELQVVSIAHTKVCDVCGFEYSLNPDESDPGCTYCYTTLPYFTGRTQSSTTATLKEDIISDLYSTEEIHYFRQGDYISIKINSKGKTVGTSLMTALFHGLQPEELIQVSYGAKIRGEKKQEIALLADIPDYTLTTDTNAAIMASAINKSVDPLHQHTKFCYLGHNHAAYGCTTHVHDDSCYTGHDHIVSRCIYHTHATECYKLHVHSAECNTVCGFFSFTGSIYTTYFNSFYCNRCKAATNTLSSGPSSLANCSSCGVLLNGSSTLAGRTFLFKCSNCKMVSSFNCGVDVTSAPSGWVHQIQSCALSGNVISCGLTESWQCGLENTRTLTCGFDEGEFVCGITENDTICMCNRIIVSLVPTHPMQFLLKGRQMVTTARVTYLDGSERTVICTADKDTSKAGENMIVTLSTFGYLSASQQGEATGKIRVTILE